MAEPPSNCPAGRRWNPLLPLQSGEQKESENHRGWRSPIPLHHIPQGSISTALTAPLLQAGQPHPTALRSDPHSSPPSSTRAPAPPHVLLAARGPTQLSALTSSPTAAPGQQHCSSGLHCISALLHSCGGSAWPHSGPSCSHTASIHPAGDTIRAGGWWDGGSPCATAAESSPRPPAAAAVRSCLQQRALRDPPRPEQQRGRGALRGGRERGKGQSSEPPSVRRGRGGEGAPHPPQCPAPPPGTAAPAPPPPACGCRRSSAGGLEGRRGAVWKSSARPPQRCAPHSPALTAHVLPAGPVHRQHLQRVEDGAVRAHRAGVSARDEPQSGWSPPERISEPSDGSAPLLRRGSPARTPPLGSPPFTSRSSAAALRPPGCNWPGAPPRVSAARGRRGAVRAAPPHRPQPPSAKEDRRGAADWPRLTCSTASCPASSPSRLKDMAEPGAAPPSLWGAPTVRFRVLRPVVPRARTLTNGERGAS